MQDKNKTKEALIKELKESQRYTRELIEVSIDSLVTISAEGKIMDVNVATELITGYSRKELIGTDFSDYFTEPQKAYQGYTQVLKEGYVRNYPLEVKHCDGKITPVLYNAAVYLEANGSIAGVFAIARDITEYKKAELEIAKNKEELESVNKELIFNERALKNLIYDLDKTHKELQSTQRQLVQSEKLASLGQLSAGVAHEINNPIGFISSNIETLEQYIESYSEILRATDILKKAVEDKDFDRASSVVKEMKDLEEKVNLDFITSDIDNLLRESKSGTERIKKIVMDLRIFARKDEGQMELNNVEEILDGVINIVWNEIKYKAELKKEYGGVPLIRCNAQKFGQVFINLLVNAAQAIEEKGEIIIKIYTTDEGHQKREKVGNPEAKKYVCIEISDTGCGIAEEDVDKIFDPFFTTKEVGKGTGLGLSVTYDIIKQHEGEIEVESELNKGTKFTIKFPLQNNNTERS